MGEPSFDFTLVGVLVCWLGAVAAVAVVPVSASSTRVAVSRSLTLAVSVSVGSELAFRSEIAVVEVLQTPPFDGLTQEFFDGSNLGRIRWYSQGEGFAALLDPSSAADAVSVGINRIGHIEIDDV